MGPWSGWRRPLRRRPPLHPPPWKVGVSRGQAGGGQGVGSSACSGDLPTPTSRPPDIGPQTSTSPGRLVRTSCGPSPRPSLQCGAGSRLHPPLFSSALASLPSRCPLKALSGRRFDYRVFAALPSSRPVYDMQVPGPPGLCGPPRPAAPVPLPVPPPVPPPAPASSFWGQPRSLGMGPPHPGSRGWSQQSGRGPHPALLPTTVPRLC